MNIQARFLAAICCLAIVLAGCASKASDTRPDSRSSASATASNPSEPKAASVPKVAEGSNQRGYFSASAGDVIWVQFTTVDGHLAGQLQRVYSTSDLQLKADNLSFTGVLNGSDISLTFAQGFVSTTVTGSLEGNKLTLVLPGDGGLLTTLALKTGTVDDFNKAATSLRQQVAGAKTRAEADRAEAKRIEDMQNAVQEANTSLARVIGRLPGDIDSIKSVSTFHDVLDSYAADWKQMQADYTLVQEESAKRPFTCYQKGRAEYAAGRVEYGLGRIEYDDGRFDYVQQQIQDRISRAKLDVQTAQTAVKYLSQVAAANITGYPKPQFTADDVTSLSAEVDKQIMQTQAVISTAKESGTTYHQNAVKFNDSTKQFVSRLTCSD